MIAVVGLACELPDASTPEQLWENVLARRRAFRRLPPERLALDDYYSADRGAEDRLYATEAALVEGYEFDRVRFRVPGAAYRAADLTHWLALDVACRALADAGFDGGDGLPRETTGVVLGNTLTGEMSRAALMRLRWPYVRRVVESALDGMGPAARGELLARIEATYKAPFEPVGDESLAGALSNTIAGRVCNHLDLGGGGYTVDGACSASLLAVATACQRLDAGELDVAVAGGVDVSIDPFELVGFAKTGALAPEEMRVYDARSQGFWPGEGCGCVVLMRLADARAAGAAVHAVIRGWGISSDGSGGITRPEAAGQLRALRRAYARADTDPSAVAYFEGHGTGTAVGDPTEIRALAAIRGSGGPLPPAALGSIKANIGHTKAAAGVAGLIKATMAVSRGVVPPTTGCDDPHPVLREAEGSLRAAEVGEPWPAAERVAGVSALGFGGINTHVVVASDGPVAPRPLDERERLLLRSAQDAELFVFAAPAADGVARAVARLRERAAGLSRAQLGDAAAALAAEVEPRLARVRAAVVASTPAELAARLAALADLLADGAAAAVGSPPGVFLGTATAPPRIGLLLPGQAAPAHPTGGAMRRRFAVVEDLYAEAPPPAADTVETAFAQPAIVRASLAALRVLAELGIEAEAAVGHSLGELTALAWAGAVDEEAVLRIATARGRAMSDLGEPGGAMASVALDPDAAAALAEGLPLAVAGLNAPAQTAVSGPAAAIEALVARARARGIAASRLRVSHAFHSPAMAPAAGALAAALDAETIERPVRRVVSTVSGAPIGDDDVRDLLRRQLTQPVRFADAAAAAFADLDLVVEAGPGRILTGLVAGALPVPAVATDAGGPSLSGLLSAAGAAWALGAPVRLEALFGARFTRPIDLDRPPRLFENPCERAPRIDAAAHAAEPQTTPSPEPPAPAPAVHGPIESADPACLAAALEAAYAAPAALLDAPAREGGAATAAPAEGAAARDAERAEAATAAPVGAAMRDANAAAAEPGGAKPAGDAPADSLGLVRGLVAARAELPLDAVLPGSRLLDDLHLNSIVVSEIAVEASRRLGLPPPPAPSALANATVEALADALADGGAAALTAAHADLDPPGAGSWTRAFAVDLVERPLRRAAAPAHATGRWHVVARPGDPLGAALPQALARDRRGGVALCLPPEPGATDLPLVLDAARAVLGGERPRRLVVAQSGGGGAGFARALHLEAPDVATCVVDVPAARRDADLVATDAAAHGSGFVEARYDAGGTRREPVLRHLPLPAEATPPSLGRGDVLLVAGGAKGIAAECALALARDARAAIACLGRTDPAADPALAAALERLRAAGRRVKYVRADVTDATAVAAAVREVEAALGPVTAVLHAAGRNEPVLVGDLDEHELRATVAPKVDGLRNVLAAVDGPSLRVLVTFGSIIARSGMRGDAHYALANEWQTLLTERFAAEHPGCACLAFESSVWSSVGMGERLGSIEALAREGIDAIPPDDGAALLARLVATAERPVAVVAAGRLGRMPTLARETAGLPLRRFLERPRVSYPGIELVADAELSTDLDPYLREHVLDGEPLLPAVVGLEAMAQAVMALSGSESPPVFDEVRFDRPVVVPEGERTTVRVAALATGATGGRVVLRSARTGFQVDHFSARWRLGEPSGDAPYDVPAGDDVGLDPGALYGTLLFHAGRFRRLRRYRALSATRCHAEIDAREPAGWFGAFLPQPLVLGDPGAHDAAIHALQACVPHARVIPVAVESAWFDPTAAAGVRHVHAAETAREDGAFTFDVAVRDGEGRLVERWDGLRLRAVSAVTPAAPWPGPLLATYLERRLEPLDRSLRVAVAEDGSAGRRERSDAAIQMAVGGPAQVLRRPDGRPETGGGHAVSTAHANGLTLAVAGTGPVACDIEPAIPRPRQVWHDLLGASGLALSDTIAADREEELATAATRVWAAGECLQKAGAPLGAPLTIGATAGDGWLTLSSGDRAVATYVTRVDGIDEPVALAVLAGGPHARL